MPSKSSRLPTDGQFGGGGQVVLRRGRASARSASVRRPEGRGGPCSRLDRSGASDLIGLVYAALDEGVGWQPFLLRYSDVLGGASTALLGQDIASDRGRVAVSTRCDPAWLRRYEEYYCSVNVWFTARKTLVTEGSVLTSQMICPDAEVLRSEYYNDFLRPQDLFHGLRGTILKEGSWSCILTALRTRRVHPFDEVELATLKVLVPHLQRALQIQRRLDGLQAFRAAAGTAFDLLPLGVILMDGSGRPLLVNRAARAIIHENDGLTLSRDGLCGATPGNTAELRRLVREASLTAAGHGLGAGGALSLPRPSLRRPLALLVGPLKAGDGEFVPAQDAAVIVFVSDPERMMEAPPDLLRRLYGLTVAESRLAALLLEGLSVARAAEKLEVSPHTARTQLKSIFLKTETRRQSELIRVVIAGPACLRPSGVP